MNYSYNEFLSLKKRKGQSIKANISSNSMSPWLRSGDIVDAKVCNLKEVNPFDIVLFWRKNTFICHVFLKVEENFIFTKPLSGNEIDPPTHKSNLLGVVHKPKFSFFQKTILKLTTRKIL